MSATCTIRVMSEADVTLATSALTATHETHEMHEMHEMHVMLAHPATLSPDARNEVRPPNVPRALRLRPSKPLLEKTMAVFACPS